MDLKSIGGTPAAAPIEARVAIQQSAAEQSEKVADKIIESVERTPEPGKGQRLSVSA